MAKTEDHETTITQELDTMIHDEPPLDELDDTVYENASEGEQSFQELQLDEIPRRSLRPNKGVPPRRLIKEALIAKDEE